jgi:hypothetical protein
MSPRRPASVPRTARQHAPGTGTAADAAPVELPSTAARPLPAGELRRLPDAIGEALAAPATAVADTAEPQLEVVSLRHDKDMRQG